MEFSPQTLAKVRLALSQIPADKPITTRELAGLVFNNEPAKAELLAKNGKALAAALPDCSVRGPAFIHPISKKTARAYLWRLPYADVGKDLIEGMENAVRHARNPHIGSEFHAEDFGCGELPVSLDRAADMIRVGTAVRNYHDQADTAALVHSEIEKIYQALEAIAGGRLSRIERAISRIERTLAARPQPVTGGDFDVVTDHCHYCGRAGRDGHAPDCALEKARKAAGA